MKLFLAETKGTTAWTWWTNQEVGHNQEATKEVKDIFGEGALFETPKPTRLIQRILQLATNSGDLVLDSFAGSGTTGHAVLKMNQATPDLPPRRFILVEMEANIAQPITAERLKRVIRGYGDMAGTGGGLRYCTLGPTLFDAAGQIRHGAVTFADLARHVFFTESGSPLPAEATGPLIGVHNGAAVYLLYNGILDDLRPDSGNVLTRSLLAALPAHDGPKIIYGNGCLLSRAYVQAQNITFRQTPYEIKIM